MSTQTVEKVLFVTNGTNGIESLKKIVDLKNITEVITNDLNMAFEMIKQRVRGSTIITEKYKISVTSVISNSTEDFVIISDMNVVTEKEKIAKPELLNFLHKEKVVIDLSSIDNMDEKVLETDTFCIIKTDVEFDIEYDEYKYFIDDLVVFRGKIEKVE